MLVKGLRLRECSEHWVQEACNDLDCVCQGRRGLETPLIEAMPAIEGSPLADLLGVPREPVGEGHWRAQRDVGLPRLERLSYRLR